MKSEYACRVYGMDISAEEMSLNTVLDESIVYDACNPDYEKDLASYASS